MGQSNAKPLLSLYKVHTKKMGAGPGTLILDVYNKQHLAAKEKMIREIARIIKPLGYNVDPSAKLDVLVKQMMSKLPSSADPKKIRGAVNKLSRACVKIGQMINKFMGYPADKGVISVKGKNAEKICADVMDLVHGLVLGINSEFLTVKAEANKILQNLDVLQNLLERSFERFSVVFRKSDSLDNRAAVEVHQAALDELQKQRSLLNLIIGSVITPQEKDLVSVLKKTKSLHDMVGKLKSHGDRKNIAYGLSLALSGFNRLVHMAKLSNKALEVVGMRMDEFQQAAKSGKASEKLLEKIKTKLTDRASIEELNNYMRALNYLKTAAYNDDLLAEMKRLKHGGVRHKGGAIKVSKQVQNRKKLTKQLLSTFHQTMLKLSNDALTSAKQLTNDIRNNKIPLSRDLREFANVLSLLPPLYQYNHYLALSGLFAGAGVKYFREVYQSRLRVLVGLIETIKRRVQSRALSGLADAFVKMLDTIKVYEKHFSKGLGTFRPQYKKAIDPFALGAFDERKGLEFGKYSSRAKDLLKRGFKRVAEKAKETGKKIVDVVSRSTKELAQEGITELDKRAFGSAQKKSHRGGLDMDTFKVILPESEVETVGFRMNELVNTIMYAIKVAQFLDSAEFVAKDVKGLTEGYEKVLGQAVALERDRIVKQIGTVKSVKVVGKQGTPGAGTTEGNYGFRLSTVATGMGFDPNVDASGWAVHEYFKNIGVDPDSGELADIRNAGGANASKLNALVDKYQTGLKRWFTKFEEDRLHSIDRFYQCVEAVDLYLKEFNNAVVKNPRQIKSIAKELESVEIITKTFNAGAIVDLIRVFESVSSPANGDPYNEEKIGSTNVGKSYEKQPGGPHYYLRLMATHAANYDTEIVNLNSTAPEGLLHIGSNILGAVAGNNWESSDRILTSSPKQIEDIVALVKSHFRGNMTWKNICSIFAKLGKGLNENLWNSVHKGIGEIYQNTIDFVAYNSFAAKQQTTNDGFVILPEYQFCTVANSTCPLAKKAFVILARVIKAMCAKVLTAIGICRMLNNPINKNTMGFYSPMRLAIGAAESVPTVIPEAVEMYARLPLLAEAYRDILADEKDGGDWISFIPDIEGVFGELLNIVFNRNATDTNSTYSNIDKADLVRCINKIYKNYKDSRDPCRKAMRELISEINHRIGILSRSEWHEYQTQKRKFREDAMGFDYANRDDQSIDMKLFDTQRSFREGPSSQYMREGYPLDADNIDDKNAINVEVHSRIINKLRSRIEKLLSSVWTGGSESNYIAHNTEALKKLDSVSLVELINARRNEIKNSTTDRERLSIAYSLISEQKEFAGGVLTRSLMLFHESVVAPLEALYMIKDRVEEFVRKFIGGANIFGIPNIGGAVGGAKGVNIPESAIKSKLATKYGLIISPTANNKILDNEIDGVYNVVSGVRLAAEIDYSMHAKKNDIIKYISPNYAFVKKTSTKFSNQKAALDKNSENVFKQAVSVGALAKYVPRKPEKLYQIGADVVTSATAPLDGTNNGNPVLILSAIANALKLAYSGAQYVLTGSDGTLHDSYLIGKYGMLHHDVGNYVNEFETPDINNTNIADYNTYHDDLLNTIGSNLDKYGNNFKSAATSKKNEKHKTEDWETIRKMKNDIKALYNNFVSTYTAMNKYPANISTLYNNVRNSISEKIKELNYLKTLQVANTATYAEIIRSLVFTLSVMRNLLSGAMGDYKYMMSTDIFGRYIANKVFGAGNAPGKTDAGPPIIIIKDARAPSGLNKITSLSGIKPPVEQVIEIEIEQSGSGIDGDDDNYYDDDDDDDDGGGGGSGSGGSDPNDNNTNQDLERDKLTVNISDVIENSVTLTSYFAFLKKVCNASYVGKYKLTSTSIEIDPDQAACYMLNISNGEDVTYMVSTYSTVANFADEIVSLIGSEAYTASDASKTPEAQYVNNLLTIIKQRAKSSVLPPEILKTICGTLPAKLNNNSFILKKLYGKIYTGKAAILINNGNMSNLLTNLDNAACDTIEIHPIKYNSRAVKAINAIDYKKYGPKNINAFIYKCVCAFLYNDLELSAISKWQACIVRVIFDPAFIGPFINLCDSIAAVDQYDSTFDNDGLIKEFVKYKNNKFLQAVANHFIEILATVYSFVNRHKKMLDSFIHIKTLVLSAAHAIDDSVDITKYTLPKITAPTQSLKYTTMQAKIANIEAQIPPIEKDIKKAEADIKSYEATKKNDLNTIVDYNTKLIKLNKDLNELNQKLANEQDDEQKKVIQTKIDDTQEEIKQTNDNIDAANECVLQSNEMIQQIQEAIDKHKDDIKALKTEIKNENKIPESPAVPHWMEYTINESYTMSTNSVAIDVLGVLTKFAKYLFVEVLHNSYFMDNNNLYYDSSLYNCVYILLLVLEPNNNKSMGKAKVFNLDTLGDLAVQVGSMMSAHYALIDKNKDKSYGYDFESFVVLYEILNNPVFSDTKGAIVSISDIIDILKETNKNITSLDDLLAEVYKIFQSFIKTDAGSQMGVLWTEIIENALTKKGKGPDGPVANYGDADIIKGDVNEYVNKLNAHYLVKPFIKALIKKLISSSRKEIKELVEKRLKYYLDGGSIMIGQNDRPLPTYELQPLTNVKFLIHKHGANVPYSKIGENIKVLLDFVGDFHGKELLEATVPGIKNKELADSLAKDLPLYQVLSLTQAPGGDSKSAKPGFNALVKAIDRSAKSDESVVYKPKVIEHMLMYTDDCSDLIKVDYTRGGISFDYSGLVNTVEQQIANIKLAIERFRGILPQKLIEQYERKDAGRKTLYEMESDFLLKYLQPGDTSSDETLKYKLGRIKAVVNSLLDTDVTVNGKREKVGSIVTNIVRLRGRVADMLTFYVRKFKEGLPGQERIYTKVLDKIVNGALSDDINNPYSSNILPSILASVLQRLYYTRIKARPVKQYMEDDFNKLSSHKKYIISVYAPYFKQYSEDLIKYAELIKKIVVNVAPDAKKETLLVKIISALGDVIATCDDLISETAENPVFYNMRDNFISNYQRRTGKLPIMPASAMLNIGRAPALTSTGSAHEKLLAGARAIMQHRSCTATLFPGVFGIVKHHNEAASGNHRFDDGLMCRIVDQLIKQTRYMGCANLYRKATSRYAGPISGILTRSPDELHNIMESTDTLQSIERLIEHILSRSQDSLSASRRQLRAFNIVDINESLINIQALSREIPLINIYNGSYTFDSTVAELLDVRYDVVKAVIGAGNQDTELVKEKLYKFICNPYAYENYEDLEMFEAIMRGQISKGSLGRPKLIEDMFTTVLGSAYRGYANESINNMSGKLHPTTRAGPEDLVDIILAQLFIADDGTVDFNRILNRPYNPDVNGKPLGNDATDYSSSKFIFNEYANKSVADQLLIDNGYDVSLVVKGAKNNHTYAAELGVFYKINDDTKILLNTNAGAGHPVFAASTVSVRDFAAIRKLIKMIMVKHNEIDQTPTSAMVSKLPHIMKGMDRVSLPPLAMYVIMSVYHFMIRSHSLYAPSNFSLTNELLGNPGLINNLGGGILNKASSFGHLDKYVPHATIPNNLASMSGKLSNIYNLDSNKYMSNVNYLDKHNHKSHIINANLPRSFIEFDTPVKRYNSALIKTLLHVGLSFRLLRLALQQEVEHTTNMVGRSISVINPHITENYGNEQSGHSDRYDVQH